MVARIKKIRSFHHAGEAMAKATDTPREVGISNMAQSTRRSQAVGRHYATSTIRTLPVIIQRTRERRDKGRSHKAAMAAFSAGATFVLVEKYSARAFWGQVQKYRATITECIPMMIRTLMVQPPSANDQQHRLREVMFYLNLSAQEKDAFCERFGVRLLTSYGMTETIVGIIGDRPGDKRRWPSIGRAGFCYEAEIRDDHNRPLPAGEIGEICIKGVPGKTIFKEYFLNPKATAKVLEADGWLHTGDTGYRDEEGFFYFVDRRCNMIKRGGENVSCVELENIIAAHPKIQDIVVVGIKDSIRDEAIKAFVVLNEGETLSEEEFFRFCEQNMAKFKVPSYLEIRKDLPRNCSGKIIRKNLK